MLRPVDKELRLLVWLDKPVDVDVDNDVMPVETEPATVDN